MHSGVRPMLPQDVPDCMTIAARCWNRKTAQNARPEFTDAFSTASYRPIYYVYDVEGRAVGMAGYGESMLSFALHDIFWVGVLPEYRGRGYGRELVSRCLEDIEHIGRVVMLITGVPEFYAKNWGFSTIAKLVTTEEFGEDLMTLQLH